MNEHLILIESRVRCGDDGVVTKNREQKQISKLKLLPELETRVLAIVPLVFQLGSCWYSLAFDSTP